MYKVYNVFVVVLFVIVLICFYNLRTDYDELEKDYLAQKIELDTMKKQPDWLIKAYTKCSTHPMNDEFLRNCTAFEIKELHH